MTPAEDLEGTTTVLIMTVRDGVVMMEEWHDLGGYLDNVREMLGEPAITSIADANQALGAASRAGVARYWVRSRDDISDALE